MAITNVKFKPGAKVYFVNPDRLLCFEQVEVTDDLIRQKGHDYIYRQAEAGQAAYTIWRKSPAYYALLVLAWHSYSGFIFDNGRRARRRRKSKPLFTINI